MNGRIICYLLSMSEPHIGLVRKSNTPLSVLYYSANFRPANAAYERAFAGFVKESRVKNYSE